MVDFSTFNLGNVLGQAENIRGAQVQRQTQEQALGRQNVLAQREAQFNPLFRQFLAGETDINALAAVDPERAAEAQEFVAERNELARREEEQQADQLARAVILVRGSANKAKTIRTLFPEVADDFEARGIVLEELTPEDFSDIERGILEQVAPISSLSFEELGLEAPEFRSTAGKQFEDRQVLVSRFGEGSPQVTRFDTATAKRGQRITIDPETGEVVFEQGVLPALQKKTVARAETEIVDIDDSIARLDAISAGFDPRFLQFSSRLGAKISGIRSQLGQDISAQDEQFLRQFSSFQRDAIENINLEIKRITGAQMSEKEADRIRQGFPDPGEGVFDGDAPPIFLSKMESVNKSLRLMRARRIILLREGINLDTLTKRGKERQFDTLTLDEVEARADARAKEIRAAGGDDAAVRQMLRNEFGL